MRLRAVCRLRESIHYRRDAFCRGLAAAGFEVVERQQRPQPCDLLVVWNRYGAYAEDANRYEQAGARVLVVENGHLGKAWRGSDWYSLALGHHSGAGRWVDGGPGRWDGWGVELAPWVRRGETLILGQRGIGEPGIASPGLWAETVQRQIGGRIRPHPGKNPALVSLERDLQGVGQVVTWHSGAALQALVLGVPVWHAFPQWIGAGAARPLSDWPNQNRDDAARLEMFRRLAWAQWELHEVETGEAIVSVLGA